VSQPLTVLHNHALPSEIRTNAAPVLEPSTPTSVAAAIVMARMTETEPVERPLGNLRNVHITTRKPPGPT
jgi:hypothetical protein